MLHLLVKLVETKLEERILDDKLRLTVEVHPRQDQEKAHTAWLRDVTTPQGAALHCKYSLAAFDAKAPFYALLTVQDETGANRVASASLDLGPLRINHTAGPVDAQVSLRTPKGAKAFTLQVSASYDGSHDDDLISDNSSEAGEDDVRTGDDPNATDNSSEAEEDDVPADETGKDMNADEKDASALFTDDSSEADEDDVRPGDDVYATDDSSEASEDDVLEEVPEAESPKAAAAKQNPRQKEQFHSENDSEQSEDDIDDDDDIASDDRQSESYGSASFADAESELKMPLVPTVDTCKESLPLQSEHHSQTSGAWEALYRVDRFESGPGQAKPKVKPVPPRRPKTPKASLPATPGSKKDRARRRKSQEETSAFLKRMDQRAEQKRHAARDLQARLDYEASLRKKVCPECGRTQSFEQVKKRQKKCIECKVLFRYSVRWDRVKDDFMDRNTVAPKRPEADHIPRRRRPSRANEDFLARMDKAAERRRQRNMQQKKSINQERSTSQEKSHELRKSQENFVQDKRKPVAKELARPRLPGEKVPLEPPFDRDLWTAEQIVIAHLFGPCESCHLDERCE